MEAQQLAHEGSVDHLIPLIQELNYCSKSPCDIPAGYSVYPNDIINDTAPVRVDAELTDSKYLSSNDLVGTTSSNITNLTIGPYIVAADIDRLGSAYMPGGSIEQSQAYHKSAENQAVSAFRITTSIPVGQSSSNMCQVIWLKTLL